MRAVACPSLPTQLEDHGARSARLLWGNHLVAGLGSHWGTGKGGAHLSGPAVQFQSKPAIILETKSAANRLISAYFGLIRDKTFIFFPTNTNKHTAACSLIGTQPSGCRNRLISIIYVQNHDLTDTNGHEWTRIAAHRERLISSQLKSKPRSRAPDWNIFYLAKILFSHINECV
jgi:hypothetical protein